MNHHPECNHKQTSCLDTLSTPHRNSTTAAMSTSLKQQSPTSVVATAHFDAASKECLNITLDPVGEDDDNDNNDNNDDNNHMMKTPKDLPQLEDASDSQESDVEREFRSLLECAIWQRQSLSASSPSRRRTSKLVEWLWTRRWDRFQDRLSSMRHRHEVGEETDLPCFTHCRGLPLHLACAMRPLPPLPIIQQLVQAFPHAAEIPESAWGMLPLHLLADLRFQRRTGSVKPPSTASRRQQQPGRRLEEIPDELEDVDLESTDSSSSSTVSEAEADDVVPHPQHKSKAGEDGLETKTLEHDCSPAAHHGKVLEIVLHAFPDAVKAREKLSGMLPLHIAACTGYSQNGLVSETSFVVLELLMKHAPETKWVKDDWGHSAVAIAWKETVFHCAMCSGAEGSNRCPHVWSLPSRFINPLFKSEKRDALREGGNPLKESENEEKKSLFPRFVHIPVDIAITIASNSADSWIESPRSTTRKRTSYEDALAGVLFGEHDKHILDKTDLVAEQDQNDIPLPVDNTQKDMEPTSSRGERAASQGDRTPSSGEHTVAVAASRGEPTSSRESSGRSQNRSHNHGHYQQQQLDESSHVSTQPRHHNENASLVRSRNDGGGTILNLDDLEVLKQCDLEQRHSKHHKHHHHLSIVANPIGKEVFVDMRFGPFGDRFGSDAKSLLSIRIHVSHLKAGKGKAKMGALVKAPNPYVELAVVARGKKTLVYQSHPLVHRSEATWDAQEVSLGLGIKTMYKQAACLFTVYHCRRKGGTPLLIGTYYCGFKDLPTSPVAICRSGKPKGLLCIKSFSLEEIPKPCDSRIRL